MEAALFHPVHGYYGAGRAAIGREGDFMTNVSVGPLFGCLLARQFAEMWDRLGRPGRFTIVEQGAHRGDFAHDVLSFLREAPCSAAVRYVIVEPAPHWRAEQQSKLAEFGAAKVEWRASLAELEPFDGVHFSNELLDAFPVHRVRWSGQAWVERKVEWVGDRFILIDGPAVDGPLREQLGLLPQPVAEGYETEVNLAALDWMTELSTKLRAGWALLIDYGYSRAEYYRSERMAGTLSAYSKHQRVSDPLATPGEVDLTAHLDFTSLAERAEACGLRVCGFTDQHRFMVGLGRVHFPDDPQPSRDRDRELRAFKTLMHPNFMGTSFKVFGVEKGASRADMPLSGFLYGKRPGDALGL